MTQNKWKQVYEPVPPALDYRLAHILESLTEEKPQARRLPLRTAIVLLALLLALGGVAYAVFSSQVADIFGWLQGDAERERLLTGDISTDISTYTLGDVTYTLEGVIYKEGMIYGTGHMRPRDGANVVLMPSDYWPWDEAGYLLHMGEEDIPEGAPTYADLAKERNAKILIPICYSQGVVESGELTSSEVGMYILPDADGSVLFTFDFQGYEGALERASAYTIQFVIGSWEVTPDGDHLREAPQDTFVRADWEVTFTPTMKGE